MTEERHDPIADEAARLISALQGMLRRNVAPGPEDVWGEVTDRIATGSAECQLCPFCQLLGMLRHARPDAYQHLAAAGDSLAAALRDVLDAHRHEWPPRSAGEPETG